MEVTLLHRGPYKELKPDNYAPDLRKTSWKDSALCNQDHGHGKAAAPAEFRRAGRAPGLRSGGARPLAHLGRGDGRSWDVGAVGAAHGDGRRRLGPAASRTLG
jgi:hypothetical protein